MTLRERGYLTEMADMPSLVQLQRKGNKKPATKAELKQARKEALRCKTATEAYEKAKDAWSFMRKRQIIQVFLDREAELLGLNQKPPKPLFIDKKNVKWVRLNKNEKQAAVNWIANSKTEDQIKVLLKQATSLYREQKTEDAAVRLKVYVAAHKEWKRVHKEWRKRANRMKRWFG